MDLFSRIGNDSPSRRFIFQGVHPGARTLRKSVLVNREVPLERWRRIRPRDDKEEEGGGEREKKRATGRQREGTIARQPGVKTSPRIHGESHSHTYIYAQRGTEGRRGGGRSNGGGSNDKVEEVEVRLPGLSQVARQCVDRKQTSGNDRGRQCAFKTRQTVICHVFHAL